MPSLREKDTDRPLGQISQEQLQYLIDNLEEEWLEDQDYAITTTLVDFFEQHSADPVLVSMLREALGDRKEIEIIWSQ